MIYFVNQYLMALNTSIEHTQIKRIKLFNHEHVPAKIVTRDFNTTLTDNLKNFGLSPQNMINMYDYFRQTQEVPTQVIKTYDLPFSKEYDVKPDANVSEVVKGSQVVMQVHHVPGTFGHVHFIDYLDYLGNLTKRRDYDSRGFKARDQLFSKEGLVIYEKHYDRFGHGKIEHYFDDKGFIIRTILYDYLGKTYYFENDTELASFFLDELNRQDNLQATFIGDRPTISYDMIMGMKTRGKNLLYMPNPHTVDENDGIYADMSGLYTNAIYKNPKQWDCIIVATDKQKNDLTKWYGGQSPIPITVISPSVQIESQQDTILDENTAHKENKVIYTSKLDAKNNVNELIEAFNKVVAVLPNATLDIYGYGTEYDTIKTKIEELKLSNSIRLLGYQADLTSAYQSAELLVYTGNIDVEPLGLIEAMSYSVPCVAYNSLYGIQDIIKDGENGFIVNKHRIDELTSTIIKTLENKKRLHKMSQNAYHTAKTYAPENMIQKWQQVLN
ncbi:glycosyltransferase [Holzapfeliella sp. He02]|uniref:Glycosyltransferase n=1 Tax=Holzapfeliella saturejae TaxID=3082953 RepID=A0ABU8SEH1_9LACO